MNGLGVLGFLYGGLKGWEEQSEEYLLEEGYNVEGSEGVSAANSLAVTLFMVNYTREGGGLVK